MTTRDVIAHRRAERLRQEKERTKQRVTERRGQLWALLNRQVTVDWLAAAPDVVVAVRRWRRHG